MFNLNKNDTTMNEVIKSLIKLCDTFSNAIILNTKDIKDLQHRINELEKRKNE